MNRVRIAAHHGDSRNQNNLEAARRVLETHPEIDIMEIDFILYCKELISSHDYTAEGVLNGSPLRDWIEMVVIQYGKTLWIDVKPLIALSALFWSIAEEVTACLYTILAEQALYAKQSHNITLRNYLFITSQDPAIKLELETRNKEGWLIAIDVPAMRSYIWQALLPPGLQEWLNDSIYNALTRNYDFSRDSIVAIDKTFFDGNLKRLFRFIETSNIQPGTTIILYTFDGDMPPLKSDQYHIVTQYDYTV